MKHRNYPQVHAGSMADIAFLLLIFFLVTTTIQTDEGLNRKLAPKENHKPKTKIKEKNLFSIIINTKGELLVEGKPLKIETLKEAAIAFIDNGGGIGNDACTYCKGLKDPFSSDNPKKAVLSITTDRQTTYKDYIAVQNELVGAYNALRDREARRLYNETYTKMDKEYNTEKSQSRKVLLKQRLEHLRALYPFHISDAKPIKVPE